MSIMSRQSQLHVKQPEVKQSGFDTKYKQELNEELEEIRTKIQASKKVEYDTKRELATLE